MIFTLEDLETTLTLDLWPTFWQIVLRVIIVLSFSRISLTREKPESNQSRKNNVCFLYEMFVRAINQHDSLNMEQCALL